MLHRMFRNTMILKVRYIPALLESLLRYAALNALTETAVLFGNHFRGPDRPQAFALGRASIRWSGGL
jgi:hypothetical protein